MLIPLKYTFAINEEVLAIRILTNFSLYSPDNMLKGWKTLKMASDRLEIQLSLTEPMLVSSFYEKDLLEVIVLKNEFFFSNETKSFVAKNFKVMSEIP